MFCCVSVIYTDAIMYCYDAREIHLETFYDKMPYKGTYSVPYVD